MGRPLDPDEFRDLALQAARDLVVSIRHYSYEHATVNWPIAGRGMDGGKGARGSGDPTASRAQFDLDAERPSDDAERARAESAERARRDAERRLRKASAKMRDIRRETGNVMWALTGRAVGQRDRPDGMAGISADDLRESLEAQERRGSS